MIYLNNAATTYPKPPSVLRAQMEALGTVPQNPLRSNGQQEDILTETRQSLGRLFNIQDWRRIFFASSATDAINRILGGLNLREIHATPDNHNSVLRPLANLPRHAEGAEQSLAVVNHCSNVTGEIRDIGQHEGLVMLDASQSAGCIPIDVDGWGIDILVFTGHKSLFGPTGTGGYYVRQGIPLRPTQFGGTGRDSSIIRYEDGDWEYEVGTQNVVGLAGLKAGIDYVLGRGVENIYRKLQDEANWLIDEMRKLPHVVLYSHGGSRQGPVISFNISGLQPADVGYILLNSYGITVRTGLHCTPLLHQELGTAPHGTVRISLSDLTSHEELDAFLKAIKAITASL